MVILEYLPDDGAFKMALQGREGDWPELMQILAKIQEDQALYHAWKYGKDTAQTFLSPKQRFEAFQEQAEKDDALEHALSLADEDEW